MMVKSAYIQRKRKSKKERLNKETNGNSITHSQNNLGHAIMDREGRNEQEIAQTLPNRTTNRRRSGVRRGAKAVGKKAESVRDTPSDRVEEGSEEVVVRQHLPSPIVLNFFLSRHRSLSIECLQLTSLPQGGEKCGNKEQKMMAAKTNKLNPMANK